MRRYVNYQVTDDNDNELLFQKQTTGDEPEYQLEIRDCCGESMIMIDMCAKQFNDLVKAVNKLKRED